MVFTEVQEVLYNLPMVNEKVLFLEVIGRGPVWRFKWSLKKVLGCIEEVLVVF